MSDLTCRWCGAQHGPMCPAIKAIEYDSDGLTVRRVEFWPPQPPQTPPVPYVAPRNPVGWPPNWGDPGVYPRLPRLIDLVTD
jgi:hypothetical protein